MDIPLDALRADPPTAFAAELRARLIAHDASAPHPRRTRAAAIALSGMAALVAVLLFTVPGVRAAAASFLAVFRVVNFVAVPVDPHRFDGLGAKHLDLEEVIGEHVQVLESASPVPVSSVEAAAAAAGFDLHLPSWLPDDSSIVEIQVTGARAARVTGDAARLRQVMDALDVTDLAVPNGLDGETATIREAPVVMIRYAHGAGHTRFIQSRSPEVTLPPGVDLVALGEIGLRLLGVDKANAGSFARTIDWTNTLIVPIPPAGTAFRQLEIDGAQGLWIGYGYQPDGQSDTNMVMWSRGNRVFGLESGQASDQVLTMANSIP